MDVVTALKTRKSIRGFLPRPVPRETLEEILKIACRAPSGANTQPWEVAVVGGEKMKELKDAIYQAAKSGVAEMSDFTHGYHGQKEPYLSRQREVGFGLYGLLGIKREDRQRREEWGLQGRRFFDAPNALVLYLDKDLGPLTVFDVGLFAQSITLTALTFGLGTCILASVARFPNIIRGMLGIPPEKKIVCGIAIGYPDDAHPANKLESTRAPLSEFTKWYGF
ncbi:MAG: nitroreductase [Chloroflexota bacterium]